MTRRNILVFALLCGLAAVPSPARAAVDVEIANAQKVFGTFDPPGETETLRVRVPAGALLFVTLKGKKQKGGAGKPAVDFQLFDEGDVEHAAALIRRGKSSAKLKKYEIPASGLWRVVVQGDGATVGDYQLIVKWKSKKTFRAEVDLADGTKNVPFAIDAGAMCDFTAKASKKSVAEPTLDVVDLLGGGTVHAFTPPTVGSKKHVEKKVGFDDFGDHVLEVSSTGAGGLAKVTIKSKAPKTNKKAKVELTSKELAASDAQGAVIGPGGGSLEVGGAGDLDGAGIDVPAGALGKPTAIIIAGGIEIDEVPGVDTDPGGPPVFFGAEGLSFETPVTLTLPFDPDLFDDEADVQVAVRNANGNVVLVPAQSVVVDLVSGLVTVIVSGFSTYQVVGPPGIGPTGTPGDLNGDDFPDFVFATGAAEAGLPDVDKVQVFPGGSPLPAGIPSTVGIEFLQESENDVFGVFTAVGDVSGDGQDDLAIAAPSADGANGRVYVFFGGTGFTGSTDVLNDADVVITGVGIEAFGGSLVIADVAGDGTPDLISSSFGGPSDFFPRIYVFNGGPGLTTGNTGSASVTITSTDGFSLFTAEAAGDVNGDGRADVVARQGFTASDDAIMVWFGGSALESANGGDEDSVNVKLSDVEGEGEIGRSTVLADLIGDGTLDIAALAPSVNEGLGEGYVFAGGTTIASKSATAADVTLDPANFDFFESRLVAGNLDGVGKDELVIADQARDLAITRGGTAFIFRAADLSTTTSLEDAFKTILGTEAFAELCSFARVGDFDQDGFDDLFLAAPRSSRAALDGGQVYVFRGRANLADLPGTDTAADMIILGQANEFLGSQLFGTGSP